MDKLKDMQNSEGAESRESRRPLRALFEKERKRRLEDKSALVFDLCVFAVGLLFSRCHVVFGAHPLGLALTSVLPVYVWAAALGSAVGALTLGADGVIYAVVTAITLFLRVIISGGGKRDGGALFGENLLLRMSASVIGGFIAAAYELLLTGMGQTGILYGGAMILLPPTLTFALSGLFGSGFGIEELAGTKRELFSLVGKDDTEKMNAVFFQVSALILLFFITLSLGELELFGISVAYIFASLATLLVSRRFGALRGLATGFLSSLGVARVYSVSFGLAGLISGLLFEFGVAYGLLGGIIALSAWSAYSAGMAGFLSTLPEYVMAAAISMPLLRAIPASKKEEAAAETKQSAAEMVGTMSLAYKNRYKGALDGLEVSLISLAGVIRNHSRGATGLEREDYLSIVKEVARRRCRSCHDRELCEREGIDPCSARAEALADILMQRGRLTGEAVNTDREFCAEAESIAEEVNRAVAAAEREKYRRIEADGTAEEYELIANLINEARDRDDAERAQNAELTAAVAEAAERYGPRGGSVRVFGSRRHHVILAGEDADGKAITSPELKSAIERVLNTRLAAPEFFRKDETALMECDSAAGYAVECAIASAEGEGGEISGDTATGFEASDGHYYALISDGMGRGATAKETSEFVSKFLKCALDFGATKETVLHLLNHSMRRGCEECSATVDLFEFDLIGGEATFLKSGAAPSYVKRESSIFRIRSETAPIGLMKSIDTERIKVEIKSGDTVIMLSDGIVQGTEDSTWLLELLSRTDAHTPKKLADEILNGARSRTKSKDDMTVLVLRINRTQSDEA